jgi:hypothetical protein
MLMLVIANLIVLFEKSADLQTFMGKVDSPNHLEMFVAFLFDNISHESLKLVVLIVPGAEDFKTVGHNFFKLFESNNHEPSCAQNLKYTA